MLIHSSSETLVTLHVTPQQHPQAQLHIHNFSSRAQHIIDLTLDEETSQEPEEQCIYDFAILSDDLTRFVTVTSEYVDIYYIDLVTGNGEHKGYIPIPDDDNALVDSAQFIAQQSPPRALLIRMSDASYRMCRFASDRIVRLHCGGHAQQYSHMLTYYNDKKNKHNDPHTLRHYQHMGVIGNQIIHYTLADRHSGLMQCHSIIDTPGDELLHFCSNTSKLIFFAATANGTVHALSLVPYLYLAKSFTFSLFAGEAIIQIAANDMCLAVVTTKRIACFTIPHFSLVKIEQLARPELAYNAVKFDANDLYLANTMGKTQLIVRSLPYSLPSHEVLIDYDSAIMRLSYAFSATIAQLTNQQNLTLAHLQYLINALLGIYANLNDDATAITIPCYCFMDLYEHLVAMGDKDASTVLTNTKAYSKRNAYWRELHRDNKAIATYSPDSTLCGITVNLTPGLAAKANKLFSDHFYGIAAIKKNDFCTIYTKIKTTIPTLMIMSNFARAGQAYALTFSQQLETDHSVEQLQATPLPGPATHHPVLPAPVFPARTTLTRLARVRSRKPVAGTMEYKGMKRAKRRLLFNPRQEYLPAQRPPINRSIHFCPFSST
tara:strand:+ start:8593 stop:10404 length:1812 start_codon:yes stop_codon:yes gene_type:complete